MISQQQRIISYIKQFGSITTRDAFLDLGIMRLGARISELRTQGYPITDTQEKSKNRYGETCYYKRYYLNDKTNKPKTKEIEQKIN